MALFATFCETCALPMVGTSCTDEQAWPWGAEALHERRVTWDCDDCGVAPGGNHHYHCDRARCRACSDQLLMCEHS